MRDMLAYAQAVIAVSPALCNLGFEYFSSRLCAELHHAYSICISYGRYSSPLGEC